MISRMTRAWIFGRDDRGRRVRAHAAGVGALVAVAQALVVLAGGERQRARAVAHDDEARFLALQELLDHDPRAGFAEAFLRHHAVDGGLRLLDAAATTTPFPAASPSALTTIGAPRLATNALARSGALERAMQRRSGCCGAP
jgi:hypothetical protein